MVLGLYNNYDPVTKKITGIALVPYITAIDTASLPANYTDISSIENWDEFGGETTLNTNQIRTEIKTLVDEKTFAASTAPEKIVASKWFVVDKVDRDTIHDPATQIENATDLSTKVNDIGIDTKLLVSGTFLKDSDVVDIEKELSKTLASANWNIYHKRDSHLSNPVPGQVYYNTNDNIVYFWNGTSWENTGGGGDPQWLDIWRKSTTNDQTGIDEGTDILLDGSRGENIPYNDTTGAATLEANGVYDLWATFAVLSIATSDTVAIQWVKASDNVPLEEGHETRIRPQSSSSDGNNQPIATLIYKPTADIDVKLRVTEYTGTPDTFSMYWDRAMGKIKRIK